MTRPETGKWKKIQEMEQRLQGKVSCCLSRLEIVLAKWESAKNKPAEVGKKIKVFKKCHSELSGWLNESVRGSFSGAPERLERFIKIMENVKQWRQGG